MAWMQGARLGAVAGLTACCFTPVPSASPPVDADWTAFPDPELTGVETRFRKQEPFEATAQQREALVPRCPVLQRATAVAETESFFLVTLEAETYDQGVRPAAILADRTLADAAHRADGDTWQLPVACTDCTLVFGRALPDGRHAACLGPGYSITIGEDGALTSP